MFEIDQTYLAYELAYRVERLTGHRSDEHPHHLPRRRGEGGEGGEGGKGVRRLRGPRRTR